MSHTPETITAELATVTGGFDLLQSVGVTGTGGFFGGLIGSYWARKETNWVTARATRRGAWIGAALLGGADFLIQNR